MEVRNENKEIAVFGGGCFWCTEAVFTSLKGVSSVVPGYMGGKSENPSYEEVAAGNGHIEVIRLEFDLSVIPFDDLLNVFFHTHDPTTRNKQGNDVGPQYRSVIFYLNEEQKSKATKFIDELNASHAYADPVVTELRPMLAFFEAEDYHKEFYERHKDEPYCQIIIAPKLEKLQERFKELIK